MERTHINGFVYYALYSYFAMELNHFVHNRIRGYGVVKRSNTEYLKGSCHV